MNAQQRRELADRLGLYVCDEQLCESYADAMMDAAEILRSDAVALEAVGVEPIGMRWRWEGGEGPWFYCAWSPDGPHKYRAPPTEVEPLYPASVALRLAEARQALRKIAAIEDKMFGGDWDEISEAREIARNALGVGHE